MAVVNSEDITIHWGGAPDPAEQTLGRWRLALFQDAAEAVDGSKLFFLYEPSEDDRCITTAGRKGLPSLVVFDTVRRAFTTEIPLNLNGALSYLFALPSPSPQTGGTQLIVGTAIKQEPNSYYSFWKVTLTADNLSVAGPPVNLLNHPLTIGGTFFMTLRDDAPELIVLSGTPLNVMRINAEAKSPQDPMEQFNIPHVAVDDLYDSFVYNSNVYFLSAYPNGQFDSSRLHILSLNTQTISTEYLRADPQRGYPIPRNEPGMAAVGNNIFLAGGETVLDNGEVNRLVDYWTLDLTTFTWNQIAAHMSSALIEPRVVYSGNRNVYVFGDFDVPLPGMPQHGTHLRIIRVSGINLINPPPYEQAVHAPQAPPADAPYPGGTLNQAAPPYPGGPTGFPSGQVPYPSGPGSVGFSPAPQAPYSGDGQPSYPVDHGGQPNYPPGPGGYQNYQGPPGGQGGNYPTTHGGNPPYNSNVQGPSDPSGLGGPQYPYYPKEKKKDCSIS